MKKHMRLLSLSLLSLFAFNIGILRAETECVIQPELLPAEVKKVLDKHVDELKKVATGRLCGAGVKRYDWLPGYYVKTGLDRALNAQKLRKFIKQQGLNLIVVPKKYIYHIPGESTKIAANYFAPGYRVIAQQIPGRQGSALNKAQEEQLRKVRKIHSDLHKGNYIVMPDGKIAIIDTDYYGMKCSRDEVIAFVAKSELAKITWKDIFIACAVPIVVVAVAAHYITPQVA